ncbi:MAG: hypothetical protein ACRDPG_04280 [Nocardioidaceae bacterium]
MTEFAEGVAVAAVWVWLGMVLGISFLEAPLKFRAPGVTIPLGLSIGRVVFKALNVSEFALLAITTLCMPAVSPGVSGWVLVIVLWVLLVAQVGVVRRRLNRRSERVLAGENLPRSREHFAYVGLEGAKVILVVALGVVALGSVL